MKSFWALPAVLRLALASHATFTVLDDILSFPQYEVGLSHSILPDSEANSKLSALSAHSSPTAAPPEADTTLDVQHFNPADATLRDSTEDATSKDGSIRAYELMVLHNQRYLCSIPAVESPPDTNSTSATQSPEDAEKELSRAVNHGEELLKGMEGNCIFFNTGWWTYSFCYNQSVKQFHSLPPQRNVPMYPPIEDSSIQSYILGQFAGASEDGKRKTGVDEAKSAKRQTTETGLAKLEQRGELKYLVHNLAGGTTCDLTGKERRVEVQFHCVPGSIDRIALIKELATCTYLMVIHTQRLCNDVAFQPPQRDKPNRISCAPVIPDGADIRDFPRLASAFGEKEHQEQLREQQPPLIEEDYPIVIGDVEFGGHRILPATPPVDPLSSNEQQMPLDLNIEGGSGSDDSAWLRNRDSLANSLVLGGHREKLVATVASSREAALSEEDLRKLTVREREIGDIANYRKQMEKMSKGKPWRLDIVETVRGREFRGIIEAEDDEGGEGDGAESNKEEGRESEVKGAEEMTDRERKKEKANGGESQDSDDEGSEEVYKEEL